MINPELLRMAQDTLVKAAAVQEARQQDRWTTKSAFIPAGDPSMTGGAAGGGAPPAAPPGGDPSGGGGAPPPGGGGGGGGGADPSAIAQATAQALMPMMGGGGAGGGGMGGGMVEPIKPKIDVNVELMMIKKMLAKMCDAMGVQIPASDMAVTSQDLTQMAMGQGAQPGGGAGGSSIPPISPIAPAGPGMGGGGAPPGAGAGAPKAASYNNGSGFDTRGLGDMASRAGAIAAICARRAAR